MFMDLQHSYSFPEPRQGNPTFDDARVLTMLCFNPIISFIVQKGKSASFGPISLIFTVSESASRADSNKM